MKYTFIVIAFLVNFAALLVVSYVLEKQQHVLAYSNSQLLMYSTTQLCTSERTMLSIMAHGARRQAAVEMGIHLPEVEGEAKLLRANALTLEAAEIDKASATIPNCPPVSQ